MKYANLRAITRTVINYQLHFKRHMVYVSFAFTLEPFRGTIAITRITTLEITIDPQHLLPQEKLQIRIMILTYYKSYPTI